THGTPIMRPPWGWCPSDTPKAFTGPGRTPSGSVANGPRSVRWARFAWTSSSWTWVIWKHGAETGSTYSATVITESPWRTPGPSRWARSAMRWLRASGVGSPACTEGAHESHQDPDGDCRHGRGLRCRRNHGSAPGQPQASPPDPAAR